MSLTKRCMELTSNDPILSQTNVKKNKVFSLLPDHLRNTLHIQYKEPMKAKNHPANPIRSKRTKKILMTITLTSVCLTKYSLADWSTSQSTPTQISMSETSPVIDPRELCYEKINLQDSYLSDTGSKQLKPIRMLGFLSRIVLNPNSIVDVYHNQKYLSAGKELVDSANLKQKENHTKKIVFLNINPISVKRYDIKSSKKQIANFQNKLRRNQKKLASFLKINFKDQSHCEKYLHSNPVILKYFESLEELKKDNHLKYKEAIDAVIFRQVIRGLNKIWNRNEFELIIGARKDRIHQTINKTSAKEVFFIGHTSKDGVTVDAQGKPFEKSFFRNRSSQIEKIHFFTCYGKKLVEYYELEPTSQLVVTWIQLKKKFSALGDLLPVNAIKNIKKMSGVKKSTSPGQEDKKLQTRQCIIEIPNLSFLDDQEVFQLRTTHDNDSFKKQTTLGYISRFQNTISLPCGVQKLALFRTSSISAPSRLETSHLKEALIKSIDTKAKCQVSRTIMFSRKDGEKVIKAALINCPADI